LVSGRVSNGAIVAVNELVAQLEGVLARVLGPQFA
jgi:hypothetical protein